MNEVPVLGRLVEAELREAWTHEARVFTPWLAQHLDELGQVVGIPLELEGTEVAVDRFHADILARNPQDDSRVLIENQLEMADHTHLGQVLTYLAGLEVHTVIWIAPLFHEAHLSALKWLNEHTKDPFAFFAVKVKVVRIGDSPLAPVFEVLARPSEWERRLQTVAEQTRPNNARGERRAAFWKRFCERHPDETRYGAPHAGSNRWHTLSEAGLIISLYLAADHVGLFIRGPWGSDGDEAHEKLEQHHAVLCERLGDNGRYDMGQRFHGDTEDPAQRDRMIDWLYDKATEYEAVLTEMFSGGG